MELFRSFMGIIIFALFALTSFFIGQMLFGLTDGISVFIAIVIGIGAEVTYRRLSNKRND
jgi:hypothetical protein